MLRWDCGEELRTIQMGVWGAAVLRPCMCGADTSSALDGLGCGKKKRRQGCRRYRTDLDA
jgi:hypothetical protein